MSARESGVRSAAGGGSRPPVWALAIGAVLALAISAAVVAAIVWPGLSASVALSDGEIADGTQSFALPYRGGEDSADADADAELAPDVESVPEPGLEPASSSGVTITPAAGWFIAPGDADTTRLLSPDRVLDVEMRLLPASEHPDDWLESRLAEHLAAVVSAGGETSVTGETDVPGGVLRETLATGFEIAHVSTADLFLAVVSLESEVLTLEAHLADTRPADAHPADADPAAPHTIDQYRATLGQLLESVRIE